MSKHLFICYSTEDDAFARKVCLHMEGRGISCWFAPKDVAPGREFELAILDAIDGSGAMLLILTQASNASRFVQSEVNRAFSTGKTWGGPNSWRLNCRWGLRFAEPLPGRQGSPAPLQPRPWKQENRTPPPLFVARRGTCVIWVRGERKGGGADESFRGTPPTELSVFQNHVYRRTSQVPHPAGGGW